MVKAYHALSLCQSMNLLFIEIERKEKNRKGKCHNNEHDQCPKMYFTYILCSCSGETSTSTPIAVEFSVKPPELKS